MGEPWLHPLTLGGVRQEALDARLQLLASALGGLVLGNARAHPDHLRQRRIGDTFAVAQAPAAMPPDALAEPVHIFLEFPREP